MPDLHAQKCLLFSPATIETAISKRNKAHAEVQDKDVGGVAQDCVTLYFTPDSTSYNKKSFD